MINSLVIGSLCHTFVESSSTRSWPFCAIASTLISRASFVDSKMGNWEWTHLENGLAFVVGHLYPQILLAAVAPPNRIYWPLDFLEQRLQAGVLLGPGQVPSLTRHDIAAAMKFVQVVRLFCTWRLQATIIKPTTLFINCGMKIH